jgi:glycerol-3-phosphate O-acyltransferase / dihydroxyacetone phosphate acyltransferase
MGLPVIGWFARKMKCIPVERPQDLAKVGTGKLIVKSETNITGVGTLFKKELMPGDTLKILGASVNYIILA